MSASVAHTRAFSSALTSELLPLLNSPTTSTEHVGDVSRRRWSDSLATRSSRRYFRASASAASISDSIGDGRLSTGETSGSACMLARCPAGQLFPRSSRLVVSSSTGGNQRDGDEIDVVGIDSASGL